MKRPPNKYYSSILMPILLLLSSMFINISSVKAASEVELLQKAWKLTGQNGASEQYQPVTPDILKDKENIRITYDLHGTCLFGNDASAIIFDQPANQNWRYVSLSKYGKNCHNGLQTVDIKLSDFVGLNPSQPIGTLHSRFWNDKYFNIDITSIKAISSTATVINQTTNNITTDQQQAFAAYKGEYWNITDNNMQIPNRTPDVVKYEQDINFYWNAYSPDSKISNDKFATRWTKTQYFEPGRYRFLSKSDDGIRVWLDNDLLIDQWNDHSTKTDGADRDIPAGNHQIKVEYYENWGDAVVDVDINKISTNTATNSNNTVDTNTYVQTVQSTGKSWEIQSVSSMKETKDKICGQDSQEFIEKWVDKAKELGVNYIAVETPYDNPSCANSVEYTKKWIDVIRSRGLKVWHRHMFLAFEGIYNTAKRRDDYLSKTAQYIKDHPDFFRSGDIFTPAPEPQNGGIQGFTGCDQGVCQFNSIADFNKWLRDAIDVSNNAFTQIGLSGQMKVGYYGFDGFVTWGCNNPDWDGILEDATIQKMGNITIDHYPELIGQTMEQGLNELQQKYPNTPIILGEWGSAGSGDIEQQVINSMSALKRPGVVGVNYWHMGMGGNEALINGDFTNRSQFDEVQSFFTGKR